jgi:hypothetical protein
VLLVNQNPDFCHKEIEEISCEVPLGSFLKRKDKIYIYIYFDNIFIRKLSTLEFREWIYQENFGLIEKGQKGLKCRRLRCP